MIWTPTAGQTGWYRLYSTTNNIRGRFRFSSLAYDNAYLDNVAEISYAGYGSGGTITLLRKSAYVGGPGSNVISQLRCSNPGGTNIVALDFFLASAVTPTAITIEFQDNLDIGVLLPNAPAYSPVVGGTPVTLAIPVKGFATSGPMTCGPFTQPAILIADPTAAVNIDGSRFIHTGSFFWDTHVPTTAHEIQIRGGSGTTENGAARVLIDMFPGTGRVVIPGELTATNPGNASRDVLTTDSAQTVKNKDLTDPSNMLPASTLPNVGTPGTYTKVTTDAQGRVTVGTNPALPPTTQSVVTGSRALGTTYQNTGTTPMFVSASINVAAGSVTALSNSANPPTVAVASNANGSASGWAVALTFWVLPGNYYKVTGGTAVFLWAESQ